jgi:hypothetical protein
VHASLLTRTLHRSSGSTFASLKIIAAADIATQAVVKRRNFVRRGFFDIVEHFLS